MFEKKARTSLNVYLNYNRDARKLAKFGEIVHHSRKLRYVVLYLDADLAEGVVTKLKKEKFVRRVVPSYYKDLGENFVGVLSRLTDAED